LQVPEWTHRDASLLIENHGHFFGAIFTEPVKLESAQWLLSIIIGAQGLTTAIETSRGFYAKKFSLMEVAEASGTVRVGALGKHTGALPCVFSILLSRQKMQAVRVRSSVEIL
jgi:hypothetical protein